MSAKDIWLPSEKVAERHACSMRTLKRRKKEPGFPQPVKRGRRLYWSLRELRAFEAQFVGRFSTAA